MSPGPRALMLRCIRILFALALGLALTRYAYDLLV